MSAPPYLRPYVRARKLAGMHTLLWEDLDAQETRFDAIVSHCRFAGLHVLDVGCGRADLLAFLRWREVPPARYTGLEALPWLARAARRRRYENCSIRICDFVREPGALDVGADVIVFSGSLNLLSSRDFYRSLETAWRATRRWLAFNFLCSPDLAGAKYLKWRHRSRVLAFARRSGAITVVDDGYEKGDCTVVMKKG